MADKERVDSVRLTENDVSSFIGVYQSLKEMQTCDSLDETALLEYTYPKLGKGWFTYHKKKDKFGKYLDDGKCQVCGKDRQYLLIKPYVPAMCYRCYQAARGYRNLLFDPLHLKRKRDLTADDCKKVVKYMNSYSKKKLIALGAIGAYLALSK